MISTNVSIGNQTVGGIAPIYIIAEIGITIPDVVFVVDTCRVKQTGFDEGKQMKVLEETFVSQASGRKRPGRAGRVRLGAGVAGRVPGARARHAAVRRAGDPPRRARARGPRRRAAPRRPAARSD